MTSGNELPPRNVLVLYQDDADKKKNTRPHWIQVNFDGADGEYDSEDGCIRGHDDRHVIVYSDEVLELDYVTAWMELP